MDSISVLVVEDNAAIQNLLARFLASEGWNVHVAGTAQEARQLAQRTEIDLALIDINLPDEDGYSLSRHLRSTYNFGIIQVTGRDQATDVVTGLDSGADDYLVKPIDLDILSARIRSLVRRIRSPMTWSSTTPAKSDHDLTVDDRYRNNTLQIRPSDTGIRIGMYYLDSNTSELFDSDNRRIPLTATEYELLELFVNNPNRIFSQAELAETRLPGSRSHAVSTVYNRVNQLRRKIESDPNKPRFIQTVYGKGYIYVPEENQ